MRQQNPDHSIDVLKDELVCGAKFTRTYEFPILKPSWHKPTKAIPFEKAYQAEDCQQWVHFYTLDRHFVRVWNNPARYLPILKRFAGVISPDFSLYRELPLAMQIWNTYRGRAIAFWLQKHRVKVVPNVRWSDRRSYQFAFEGLQPGGTVSVSTNGCIRNALDRHYFKRGLDKMIKSLKPQTIINYSQTPDDIFLKYRDKGMEIVEIPHYAITIRKKVK